MMLREGRQPRRVTHCVIPFTGHLEKTKSAVMENRPLAARDER